MIFYKSYNKSSKNKPDIENETNENFDSIFSTPKLVQKNRAIAFVLCLLFGVFGFHRFYLGKFITGSLQLILALLCLWNFMAWLCFTFAIIDLLRIAFDERFTKKLLFNLNIDFSDFSDFTTNKNSQYSKSPFSNFNNRENEPTIRELKEDEVIVTDSYQPKIIHKKDN